MTSTAIPAQGSVLQIATGTGSAKTITAVAVGNPTILTASAHGFANGDVVTLAALTGADAATLNGLTISVRNITTNTFAVYVDTTAKTITAGSGTATPVTFTAIANIKDFSGFDGAASEIDVTNLDSLAKEFRLGLTDPGQFTINIDYDNTNAGHVDSAELTEWQAFYALEPFGELVADQRHGIATAVLANVNRDPKRRPQPYRATDFIHWHPSHREVQPDVPWPDGIAADDLEAQSRLIKRALFKAN